MGFINAHPRQDKKGDAKDDDDAARDHLRDTIGMHGHMACAKKTHSIALQPWMHHFRERHCIRPTRRPKFMVSV